MGDIKLDVLFEKWVDRLKLNDWEISVKIVKKDELPANRSGLCNSILSKKTAQILLLDPADADPTWLNAYDFELTFVHELIHLHLAPWGMLFEEGDQAEVFLEQAVHAFSASLVDADRRSGSWA